MRKTGLIWTVIGLIVIVGIIWGLVALSNTPSRLDSFATCLKKKGTIFYGAFWCQHCQNQKRIFGRSQKLLPYIECSTPDGKGQLSSCAEKGVKGYPTWQFANGEKIEGEMTLQALAEKTGCLLPENTN
jgi:hypothetical protein